MCKVNQFSLNTNEEDIAIVYQKIKDEEMLEKIKDEEKNAQEEKDNSMYYWL